MQDLDFDFIGYGLCATDQCNVRDKTCDLNGYYRGKINTDECRTTCLQESSCIGFASSTEEHPRIPNKCFIYGNVSSTGKFSNWFVFFNGKLSTRRKFSEWNAFFRSRKNLPTKSTGFDTQTSCWRRKGIKISNIMLIFFGFI